MRETTTPDDFDPIFKQGVLVVGGHAVNLWARYYAPRGDRELQQFEPFTSKDGDIYLRDKEMAIAVAATAGWNFRDNPEVRSPMLGHIYIERDGQELRVDVLRSVTGVTDSELTSTEELQFKSGRMYQLPAPDVMLQAKIANLAEHAQEKRQDARHVQIMVVCCRHYLTDYYSAVVTNKATEREAVDRFMSTVRVVRSPTAQRMDSQHGLNLRAVIPSREKLAELPRLPRLSAFYDHQMRIEGPRISM